MYTGELISLGVAASWTATALFFEYAGRRIGSTLVLNVIRLGMALVLLMLTLNFTNGMLFPTDASAQAWLWLGISGLIGYVFGDFCLFSSYQIIGSRFGQLFMTLAPMFAAITSWIILGEKLQLNSIAGIIVTMTGIAISVVSRDGHHEKMHLTLPLKGILFGIGAGMGQGVGLVFSKLGMNFYLQDTRLSSFMIPFASTEIRCIVGLIGFLLILIVTKKSKLLFRTLHDRKTMLATGGGTIFGPFLGVSFSLMALNYTKAGIASTLMALTPIMILVPYHFIYKQKISVQSIIGAVISVAGASLFFI